MMNNQTWKECWNPSNLLILSQGTFGRDVEGNLAQSKTNFKTFVRVKARPRKHAKKSNVIDKSIQTSQVRKFNWIFLFGCLTEFNFAKADVDGR